LFEDIFSRKIVDYKVHDRVCGERAAEWILCTTGNISVNPQDTVVFEVGYGELDGSDQQVQKDDSGFANSRLRWFHLFEMDYSVPHWLLW
jgi:hypothetical protein